MKKRAWIALLVVSLGDQYRVPAAPLLAEGSSAARLASGWHAGPMRHNLGLSAKQAQQLEAERDRVLAQAKPLQDELRRKRRELFVLLKRQTVTDGELDPILGEISRLQAGIEKMFILHSLKVRGYFSPQPRCTSSRATWSRDFARAWSPERPARREKCPAAPAARTGKTEESKLKTVNL